MSYIPPDQYLDKNQEYENSNNEKKSRTNSQSSAVELYSKIVNLQSSLKSKSKNVFCPFCLKQGMTKTEQSCSGLTGFLCCVGGFFIPTLIQLCRGKDLNCNDTDHFCFNCGNKLASYKSC